MRKIVFNGYILDDLLRMRAAIRHHRDQRGDNRCWLNDWKLWRNLEDTILNDATIPKDAMARCEAYYRNRRSDAPEAIPENAIRATRRWNEDIDGLGRGGTLREMRRVEAAIRAHRDAEDGEHTANHDRALYAVLPENLPADFRLPPRDEFLGETLSPNAGCPAFWRSHGFCADGCHDLHRWGPCMAKTNEKRLG